MCRRQAELVWQEGGGGKGGGAGQWDAKGALLLGHNAVGPDEKALFRAMRDVRPEYKTILRNSVSWPYICMLWHPVASNTAV